MSTSDKLIYLNGTKQKLKEAINDLGGDITSETTFREYAQELQDIYDNIPKTTDTGTNLSLNTIKGKMNIIPKGDTSQNGTPTPDTPIDIEVVTGTQEVKVENVNLCKNAIVNATSGAYVDILYVDMDLKPNTTYTISFIGTTNNKIYLNENITTPQYITCTGNRQSLTFTTKSTLDKTNTSQYKASANGWIIFKNNSSNTETPSFNDVQVEKGSTATTYTPHQEQTQIVELSSKNILNLSIIGKVPSVTNGNLVDSTTGACSDFIEVDNAKHYMLSFSGLSYMYAFLYGADKSYITAQQYNTSGSYDISTITNFNTCKYVRIRIDNKDYIESPQLEEGSSATPFEEYYNYELCKIGNYQDYLYKSGGKWYKKEQIGKHTFTGNETYTTWTNNRVVIANTPNNYLKVASNVTAPIICTHYKASSRDGIQTTNNAISFYATTDSASGTIVNDSEHNTNTLLKEFMTANNVEIYYAVATPQDIEITNTTLIEQLNNLEKMYSYNGTTNISSNGNLPIVLGVSALKGES